MNLHKKLKNHYKDTLRPMGVYQVLNQEDGALLIGVAKDVQARLNRHKAELKFGKHRNKVLQADWNHLGEKRFIFQIVDLLSPPKEPDNDPSEDLGELLELTLAQKEYCHSKLYNSLKRKNWKLQQTMYMVAE